MISGYHLNVAEHYEKFPYPAYPPFAVGRWKDLESVDCSLWGARQKIRDIWIAGSGTIAPFMFGRRNYSANILASDLSRNSLQICGRRLRLFGVKNVLLKCEDIFDASYESQFDAIDSYGVLHHTISPQKSLEKLVRALRSGGVLRLMVYSEEARAEIESLRAEIRSQNLSDIEIVKKFLNDRRIALAGDLASREGIADALLNPMVHTFSREQFEELLKNSGLEILKTNLQANFIAVGRKP